jgi:alpha-tubulin suppressor-like RCC1 family protein
VRFDRVTAGQSHSCGETTGNQLYCWGTNYSGQLGDGTTTERSTPVALAGGLRFAQASAGAGDTCARTAEAKGYCWGANDFGKLGDGSMTDRHKATAVAGPM